MPNVLIVAETDLAPRLGKTCLWSRTVRRVTTSHAEVAIDLVRVFVPSLVVIDTQDVARGLDLVRSFRSHLGTRRSSLVLSLPEGSRADEDLASQAGANLVLAGEADALRLDERLAVLLSVPLRVALQFPVEVHVAGSEPTLAQAVDLSSAGMLLELPEPPGVGTRLLLRFAPPPCEDPVSVEASVVRRLAGQPGRIGVHFCPLDVADQVRLLAAVSSVPVERAFGRYEPRAVIGEGAMGRVYRAFDPEAQRVVALKTVRPDQLAGRDGVEYLRRFQREARAAARLVHPNIVTIFDVGRDYFVMELLAGASLQELIAAHGRLTLDELRPILAEVASALDYAHGAGTVHRDVKPANIVIARDGHAKVMDFGLAQLASASGTDSDCLLVGSPAYMAPEQITGGEVSGRADVFALAAVAYEALTGQRPFEGRSVAAVLWNVVNSEPRPASLACPQLLPAHDAVFARALAKDAARRFASSGDFVEALLPGSMAASREAAVRRLVDTSSALPHPAERHGPGVETTDLGRRGLPEGT
jgi:hypothetical protein